MSTMRISVTEQTFVVDGIKANFRQGTPLKKSGDGGGGDGGELHSLQLPVYHFFSTLSTLTANPPAPPSSLMYYVGTPVDGRECDGYREFSAEVRIQLQQSSFAFHSILFSFLSILFSLFFSFLQKWFCYLSDRLPVGIKVRPGGNCSRQYWHHLHH